MICMMDTDDRLPELEREVGMPCEQLVTPRDGSPRGRLVREGMFAVDNGAFRGFHAARFQQRIEALAPHKQRCRFVAVPDAIASGIGPKGQPMGGPPVGDARLTLDLFNDRKEHFPYLAGWPLAYVIQDGQEAVSVPWRSIRAVFVGGSNRYKDGPHAAAVVRVAKMRGLWVHVGRINNPERLLHFHALGADSFDGTGLSTGRTDQRLAIAEAWRSARGGPTPAPLLRSLFHEAA